MRKTWRRDSRRRHHVQLPVFRLDTIYRQVLTELDPGFFPPERGA
jgi:hypothetical protein